MARLETLTYETGDRVARITLNRPARGNGITPRMPTEIAACVERANLDPAVHAIALAGNGSGFCGGYDLVASAEGEMAELGGAQAPGGSPLDPATIATNRVGLQLGPRHRLPVHVAQRPRLHEPLVVRALAPLRLDGASRSARRRFGFSIAVLSVVATIHASQLMCRLWLEMPSDRSPRLLAIALLFPLVAAGLAWGWEKLAYLGVTSRKDNLVVWVLLVLATGVGIGIYAGHPRRSAQLVAIVALLGMIFAAVLGWFAMLLVGAQHGAI